MSTTAAPHPQSHPAPPARTRPKRSRRLGRYIALDTRQQREVVRIKLRDGGTLVVDYERGSLDDGRLVAHLAPDEPGQNAQIVCDLYLADQSRGHCRPLSPQDFEVTAHAATPAGTIQPAPPTSSLRDADGHVYRIRELPLTGAPLGGCRRELRWTRSLRPDREDAYAAVSVRQVIGSLQAYEPALTITRDALAHSDERVCVRPLREQLDRLAESPIVLNKRLRHEVQHRVGRGDVSMSQIAMRCGKVKRGPRGNLSGQTSWLARRIGLMPEAGSGSRARGFTATCSRASQGTGSASARTRWKSCEAQRAGVRCGPCLAASSHAAACAAPRTRAAQSDLPAKGAT